VSTSREIQLVSIVVPTLDGASTIGEQLRALTSQHSSCPYEIVVVDNGSSDDTAKAVDSWARTDPRVRLVSEPMKGLNIARNTGTRAARGELVLLCDSDDVAEDGWIEAMVRASADAELLGGSMILDKINSRRTLERWGLGTTDELSANGNRPYSWLPAPFGANCAFTRAVFDRVGGFDERFTAGGDDFEFFWRAQLAGAQYRSVDDARVHYRLRTDWRQILRRQYRFGRANVHIAQVFDSRGIPRSSVSAALRTWIWLVATAPAVPFHRSHRGKWLRTAAKRSGRAVESARRRFVYL
jgi:glycosyltransferase involved in cell wall biosynthesis